MKISKSHQRFANRLRSPRSLEHPEEFLGKNWKDVLNFWFFLDILTKDQWNSIDDAYFSLSSDELRAARLAAGDAAHDIAANAWLSAWLASSYVASYVAADTSHELIGSHILKEQGKSLVFLPMFLNL